VIHGALIEAEEEELVLLYGTVMPAVGMPVCDRMDGLTKTI
jgi:hypothetical protein